MTTCFCGCAEQLHWLLRFVILNVV
uniref:Uncharacterized protein n=1 Tax=Arundo donax TaxID=35708 RepID=A0A0A9AYD5_ARUDO